MDISIRATSSPDITVIVVSANQFDINVGGSSSYTYKRSNLVKVSCRSKTILKLLWAIPRILSHQSHFIS